MSQHLVRYVAAKVTTQQMPAVPVSPLDLSAHSLCHVGRGKNKKCALFNDLWTQQKMKVNY